MASTHKSHSISHITSSSLTCLSTHVSQTRPTGRLRLEPYALPRGAPDGSRRRRLRAVRGGLLADSGQISEVKVEPASGPEDSAQPDAELSWAERKSLHFEIRKTQTAAAPLTQPETAPAECTLRHRRTPRRCSRRSSAPM